MGVCDICGAPGEGTHVSSEDIRRAVFNKGFDPYALGLTPTLGAPANFMFQRWKGIVAQDTSDWNICARCMLKLTAFLEGKPKPTGVSKSTVSMIPSVGQAASKEVEEEYKRKKLWQFWKR